MCNATICSAKPNSVKSDGPVSETEGSKNFWTLDESCETMTSDPNNWRTPLIYYLENPGHIVDRKV
jgi:hypothetical protein